MPEVANHVILSARYGLASAFGGCHQGGSGVVQMANCTMYACFHISVTAPRQQTASTSTEYQ